jgi:hypothetical protein
MASRLGSPNRDKKAVRDLAAEHGVDVIEMRIMLLKDCFKSIENEIGKPRSRRSKQFFQAEEMANKHLSELTPYLHGKLSNVTVTDETPRLTVIRAPETVGSSTAWLDKFAPKIDATINDRQAIPPIPFARSLANTMDMADELGIDDVGEIVGQATRFTKS